MKIEELKLEEVHPYDRNPRKNENSVDKVAESIRQFGFRVPITVDAEHVIITGHTRFLAAKKLALETVPVIVCDDLTEDQVRAYRLADNKVGESSKWDRDLLIDELKALEDTEIGVKMGDMGFDLRKLLEESEAKCKADGYFTPTGECPSVRECMDTSLTRLLIPRIDELDVEPEVKELLKAGAMRRIFFNFDKVAEFYAHQSPLVQQLMVDCDLIEVGKKKKRRQNDPKLVK